MKRATFILIGLFALPALPAFAYAATLGVIAQPASALIGQAVKVSVALDTQGDAVNAIAGEIDFPASQFSLEGIENGGSPVSFWIVSPRESSSGTVSFSGIMPGGFQGTASSVLSITLVPRTAGQASVSLGNVQILRNDGKGTAVPVTVGSTTIAVGQGAASGTFPHPASFISPDPFTPVIGRDPDVYGGAYFLAFSTTDEGSGIDHYEVLEVSGHAEGSGAVASWVTATSPYLLKDQTLSSDIYVRAVDHAGNFIIVELPAGKGTSSATDVVLITIAACYWIAFGWFLLRRRA